MPQRSREAYLWDIADSCRAILAYVQNSDLSDFEQNRMLRRAVERELSIVGEAMSQATRHFPELEESIDSVREITGRKRERVFDYTRYLAILNEGTEPLRKRFRRRCSG